MQHVTKIIARLLPLLDLTILLLGMFVILMTFSRFEEASEAAQNKEREDVVSQYVQLAATENFNTICLFAACEGDVGFEPGKCYELSQDFRRGDLAQNERIRRRIQFNAPRKTIVCLITSVGAWESIWTDEKLKDLKEEWGPDNIEVVRVRNVDFDD